MTWIASCLSVFCKAFSERAFSPTYVLSLTFLHSIIYTVCKGSRITGYMLSDLSCFSSATESVGRFTVIDVRTGEATIFRITAKPARTGGWVNDGKEQSVLLRRCSEE